MKCSKCGLEKPISEFYIRKTNRFSYCKLCNKADASKWSKDHPDRVHQVAAKWRAEHRETCNARSKAWRKASPQHAIAADGRTILTKIIGKKRPYEKFIKDVIGLDNRDEFIKYLESTIPEGFTMADYGKGKSLCIDHIKPCVRFDLTDPVEYKKCFNHSNLRLVTFKENYVKGAK